MRVELMEGGGNCRFRHLGSIDRIDIVLLDDIENKIELSPLTIHHLDAAAALLIFIIRKRQKHTQNHSEEDLDEPDKGVVFVLRHF